MAEIIISKLKLIRGTNDQRKLVILDQGEPAYTTDTKRVFVGTGTLSGGFVVGSKVHSPLLNFFSLSTLAGEIGDLVNVNNKFYQLTALNASDVSSWADVSARVDTRFLSYDASNAITLNLSALSASYINPSTIGDGLKVDAGILQLDYSTESLEISGNSVAIKAGGITERNIASTALSSGLTGGSGLPIQLDIDTDYFMFDGNKLSLSSIPTFPLEFSDLDPAWFSDGLTYDSGGEVITAVIAGVDNSTIQLSANEISVNPDMFGAGLNYDLGTDVVSLSEIGAASTTEWPMISVDVHGRVTSTQNAVYDIFKSDSSLSGFNYKDSLSGIFNGSPTGVWSPLDPTTSLITRFTALSSDNTTVVELSSAGFLVFEGNYQTRGGANDTINRFAIPIFRF
jgi:hypothetical protein